MEKDRVAERENRTVISAPPKLKQKSWAYFEHLKVNDFVQDDFDEDEEEEPEKYVDPRQISLFGEDEFPPVSQQQFKLADEKIENDEIDNEDLDSRWDEFEHANYEKKITIFLNTLEEKKLNNRDTLFEMLSAIQSEAKQRKQQDRFFSLLAKLEHDFPDVYDADAGYYLEWKIEDAIFHSRRDDVIRLLNEFAPRAGKDIDVFNNVADMLAYHGYQAPL
jgi:hypothetical protein